MTTDRPNTHDRILTAAVLLWCAFWTVAGVVGLALYFRII